LRIPLDQLCAFSCIRGLTPRCARPSTALGLRVRNDRENCWRHSHVTNGNDDGKLGSKKEGLYVSKTHIIMVQLLTLSLGLSSYFQCNIKSTATQAFSPSAHIDLERQGHTTATSAPDAPTDGIPTRLKFPPRIFPNKPPAK
jgi:hypothetical protein